MIFIEIATKFHFLFLGLLLLTHFSVGNVLRDRVPHVDEHPASETYDSKKDIAFKNLSNIEPISLLADDVECEESLPKEHFEKFEKLSIFASEQLTLLYDYAFHALKNLFAKIIEEGSSQPSLKEKLEEFKKLKNQFTEVENNNNYLDKFKTIEDAADLLDQYNLTEIKNPTKEDELIVVILKKLNLEALENQTDRMVKDITESLISKAEAYKISLTPEERRNGKSFDDWLTKCRNEDDDSLGDCFFEFFDLYCFGYRDHHDPKTYKDINITIK